MYEYIARRFPLKMNLQLFAADGGASGGSGGEGGGEDGAGGTGGEGGSGTNGSEKSFTQAELDQHVQSRLSRAEKAAQKQLAKDLGFDSVEAMQAALKPKDKDGKEGKLDPAEVDRLVDEKIKAREKEQNDKTFKRLLNAEVKVMANELGFADWEDAAALADLSAVKENDKGELEGVKESLEALAKKKPHLLKAKQGSGRIGANVPNSPEQKQKKHEDIVNLAKSRGVIGGQAVNDPWARK
ncbi:scaffolding protein [Paenibacillus sp. FSL W8-0187]|uniref:scaffolding protein n=1 Tax=Paenibacillus sp. FSL W8-0187 TaxID=2921710 RepID=UPI0030D822D4